MDLRNIDFLRLHIESIIVDSEHLSFQKIYQKNAYLPLKRYSLDGLRFARSKLNSCLFHRASLTRCDFSYSSARNANFTGADLTNANFEGTDLSGAIFCGSDLSGVNFKEAILENAHFKHCIMDNVTFKNTSAKGVAMTFCTIKNSSIQHSDFRHSSLFLSVIANTEINSSWFNYSDLRRIKIKKTKITSIDLSKSNLHYSNISESEFKETSFDSSHLNDITINNCDFSSVSFNGTDLSYSTIDSSRFNSSSFDNAGFFRSNFSEVIFNKSSFVNMSFSYCSISDCDLNKSNYSNVSFVSLNLIPFITDKEKMIQDCSIDHKSIALTLNTMNIHPLELNPAPHLITFLEDCGMHTIPAMYAIDSIRSLQPNQLDTLMKSTFISYGAPDEEFAQKLNKDLKNKGVTTFFFPENASFGEKVHSMMRGLNKYDRIILICSEQSLNRNGLLYEIEKTLEREARDGGESYLIPIRLDNFVLDKWSPKLEHMKEEVLSRVVADFTNKELYDQQFKRLLHALKNKAP
jgi:uncharacterized protein YjbI with pentapeptide repeats